MRARIILLAAAILCGTFSLTSPADADWYRQGPYGGGPRPQEWHRPPPPPFRPYGYGYGYRPAFRPPPFYLGAPPVIVAPPPFYTRPPVYAPPPVYGPPPGYYYGY